jgi:type II secretory pathway predicted ATPase ExeA
MVDEKTRMERLARMSSLAAETRRMIADLAERRVEALREAVHEGSAGPVVSVDEAARRLGEEE